MLRSTSPSVTTRCCAHATQIDPKGFFFTAPMEWQQRLWPTEEFELARSRVPVNLPETDLFAGIEPMTDLLMIVLA